MARKGKSKHLKRLPAPVGWPIHRKEYKWVVRPRPGPHPLSKSLPLILIVREILGLVKNRAEAKMMLSQGHVKVDGKFRYKDDYPVGLMDIVEIPYMEKTFRVFPSKKGLSLYNITEEEKFKLCKIIGKSTVRGGDLQLHTHDGHNLLIKNTDLNKNAAEYNPYDVLKVQIPSYEILDYLKFERGVLGVVEAGKRAGIRAEVIAIMERTWHSTTSVVMKDFEGSQFETILDYVFPIGKDEPWITLPAEGI